VIIAIPETQRISESKSPEVEPKSSIQLNQAFFPIITLPHSNQAIIFADIYEVNRRFIRERWVSGLNQQFAKLSYMSKCTGGSNPPLSA